MSLHACPGECFYFGQPFGQFFGKKLSFWLSACSVLIVVPLLEMRPSFPLVSWTEGIRYFYRFLIIAFLSIGTVIAENTPGDIVKDRLRCQQMRCRFLGPVVQS